MKHSSFESENRRAEDTIARFLIPSLVVEILREQQEMVAKVGSVGFTQVRKTYPI